MQIIGYILIGLGAIALIGNLTGAGGAGDPDPLRANTRIGCHALAISLGGLFVWLGS